MTAEQKLDTNFCIPKEAAKFCFSKESNAAPEGDEMANDPITPETPDSEIWKRGWEIARSFGVPVAFAQHVLLLERRIAKLEQSSLPAHLQSLEKR